MIHAQEGIDTVLIAPLVAADTNALAGTWDTVSVDGSAMYAEIRISLGAEPNTNGTGPTISLLECDTTVVTDHATFDSNFERADEDITAAKELRYLVDLHGRKRYLRLTVTPTVTNTNSNCVCAAIGTLTRNGIAPGSTTDMGDDVVVIG